MNDKPIGRCWQCKRPLFKNEYGRETTCLGCDKATRVCRNCTHFAPGRSNQCKEPMTEWVKDKTRANFCELFDPTDTPATDSKSESTDKLMQAAADLFK